MAVAEFAAEIYGAGFVPDSYLHPQIDLRTPEERERDEWIGERSERRIASVLRGIQVGGRRIIHEIVRYEKGSLEDSEGRDMTVVFAEGSPIEKVHVQAKSGPMGERKFLAKMEEDMKRRGVIGISPMDWMAINGFILLNGRERRTQIIKDFKIQLFRVLQMQRVV